MRVEVDEYYLIKGLGQEALAAFVSCTLCLSRTSLVLTATYFSENISWFLPIVVWYTPVFRGSYTYSRVVFRGSCTYGRVVYSELLPCFEVNRVCVVLVSTTLLKIIYYVGLPILELELIFLIFCSEICSYHSPRKLDQK